MNQTLICIYLNSKKAETNPLYLNKDWPKYSAIVTVIYTDGSKDKNNVAAATAVINHDVFYVRLLNEATIFTVEAKAIQLALEHIKIMKDTYFTISESLSFFYLSIL